MKSSSILLLGIITMFLIFPRESYSLSVADFTPILDKKVAKMKTTQEKVEWLQSFYDLLSSPKYTKSKDAGLYKKVREYTLNMLEVFEYQLKEEQSNNGNKSSANIITSNISTSTSKSASNLGLPHIPDNFTNINEQKVRDTILLRHNEERKSIGINPYNYNLNLEGSATTRANKIAVSHKTNNFHLRNSGDGYYNYNSILDRFSDLGITFPKSINGATSFSETVGYGTYNCSKSDCTQTLIEAIKKTWDNLIIKEKTSNGSHYKAATMKHFTQMGAGIAIDKSNNRYYLVIHYGVNL